MTSIQTLKYLFGEESSDDSEVLSAALDSLATTIATLTHVRRGKMGVKGNAERWGLKPSFVFESGGSEYNPLGELYWQLMQDDEDLNVVAHWTQAPTAPSAALMSVGITAVVVFVAFVQKHQTSTSMFSELGIADRTMQQLNMLAADFPGVELPNTKMLRTLHSWVEAVRGLGDAALRVKKTAVVTLDTLQAEVLAGVVVDPLVVESLSKRVYVQLKTEHAVNVFDSASLDIQIPILALPFHLTKPLKMYREMPKGKVNSVMRLIEQSSRLAHDSVARRNPKVQPELQVMLAVAQVGQNMLAMEIRRSSASDLATSYGWTVEIHNMDPTDLVLDESKLAALFGENWIGISETVGRQHFHARAMMYVPSRLADGRVNVSGMEFDKQVFSEIIVHDSRLTQFDVDDSSDSTRLWLNSPDNTMKSWPFLFYDDELQVLTHFRVERHLRKPDSVMPMATIETYPIREEYLTVHCMTKGSEVTLQKFHSLIPRLLHLYRSHSSRYASKLAVTSPASPLKLEDPNSIRQPTDLEILKAVDLEVFGHNYTKKCQASDDSITNRLPRYVPDSEYETMSAEERSKCLRFPSNGKEGHWFTCQHRSNFGIIRLSSSEVPCCFQLPGQAVVGSGPDESKKTTKKSKTISAIASYVKTSATQALEFGRRGAVVDNIKQLLTTKVHEKLHWNRLGMHRTKHSALECLLYALNFHNPKSFRRYFENANAPMDSEALGSIRARLADTIESDSTYRNLAAQEMFQFADPIEIAAYVRNPELVLDPSLVLRLLEHAFRCSIYVIYRSRSASGNNSKGGFALPNYEWYHVAHPYSTSRPESDIPIVLLYRNDDIRDSLRYAQFDLVISSIHLDFRIYHTTLIPWHSDEWFDRMGLLEVEAAVAPLQKNLLNLRSAFIRNDNEVIGQLALLVDADQMAEMAIYLTADIEFVHSLLSLAMLSTNSKSTTIVYVADVQTVLQSSLPDTLHLTQQYLDSFGKCIGYSALWTDGEGTQHPLVIQTSPIPPSSTLSLAVDSSFSLSSSYWNLAPLIVAVGFLSSLVEAGSGGEMMQERNLRLTQSTDLANQPHALHLHLNETTRITLRLLLPNTSRLPFEHEIFDVPFPVAPVALAGFIPQRFVEVERTSRLLFETVKILYSQYLGKNLDRPDLQNVQSFITSNSIVVSGYELRSPSDNSIHSLYGAFTDSTGRIKFPDEDLVRRIARALHREQSYYATWRDFMQENLADSVPVQNYYRNIRDFRTTATDSVVSMDNLANYSTWMGQPSELVLLSNPKRINQKKSSLGSYVVLDSDTDQYYLCVNLKQIHPLSSTGGEWQEEEWTIDKNPADGSLKLLRQTTTSSSYIKLTYLEPSPSDYPVARVLPLDSSHGQLMLPTFSGIQA